MNFSLESIGEASEGFEMNEINQQMENYSDLLSEAQQVGDFEAVDLYRKKLEAIQEAYREKFGAHQGEETVESPETDEKPGAHQGAHQGEISFGASLETHERRVEAAQRRVKQMNGYHQSNPTDKTRLDLDYAVKDLKHELRELDWRKKHPQG